MPRLFFRIGVNCGAPRAYARGTLHMLRRAQHSDPSAKAYGRRAEAYHPSPMLLRIFSSHHSRVYPAFVALGYYGVVGHPWLSTKEGKGRTLLIAQRLDGIEFGSLFSRMEAKKYTDGRRNTACQKNRTGRNHGLPAAEIR